MNIKIKLTKENYSILMPFIKESIHDNDVEILEYIEQFEALDEIMSKTEIKKPFIMEEYEEFFNLINDFIQSGEIELSAELKEKAIDLLNEEKKNTPTTHTSRSAYINGKIQQKQSTTADWSEKTKKTVEKDNSLTSSDQFSSKNNTPLKNSSTVQTTRSAYVLTKKDRSDIQKLKLPERKVYIYKEVRKRFGAPVNLKILYEYGLNRFARWLEKNYPDGFKRTTIKEVVNLILSYDKHFLTE